VEIETFLLVNVCNWFQIIIVIVEISMISMMFLFIYMVANEY